MLTCIKGPKIKPVENIYPDISRIKYPLRTILQTRTQSNHWRHTKPESPTEQPISGLRVTFQRVRVLQEEQNNQSCVWCNYLSLFNLLSLPS
jgi:hypothetical protein